MSPVAKKMLKSGKPVEIVFPFYEYRIVISDLDGRIYA